MAYLYTPDDRETKFKLFHRLGDLTPYHLARIKQNVVERVHFIGQITDEEMPKLYTTIDYVVLPYLQTTYGQSASGPATFALEFNCKAIFSHIPVFHSLEHYFKKAMFFSSVGNYQELAENILRYDNFTNDLSTRRKQALSHYNPEKMIRKYEQWLGINTEKHNGVSS